jgi:hypothetical protein
MEYKMMLLKKFSTALLSCAALFSIAPAANASLIALYTYDTASNLGLDSSGNGNNLSSKNSTPGATTGVYGGGINFSGTNALYSLTGTLVGLPTGGSSYAITSWINPTVANNGGIVGWGNYNSTNQVDALRLNGNGLRNYWWSNDLDASASNNLYTGTGNAGWHFVAATYDATTKVNSIYIDGLLVGTRTATGLNAAATNFAIGVTNYSEFFNGQMDNTAIFNTSLSLAQLNAISANNFSQFGAAAVPEPGSVLLLALGALAAYGVTRRKKSS